MTGSSLQTRCLNLGTRCLMASRLRRDYLTRATNITNAKVRMLVECKIYSREQRLVSVRRRRRRRLHVGAVVAHAERDGPARGGAAHAGHGARVRGAAQRRAVHRRQQVARAQQPVRRPACRTEADVQLTLANINVSSIRPLAIAQFTLGASLSQDSSSGAGSMIRRLHEPHLVLSHLTWLQLASDADFAASFIASLLSEKINWRSMVNALPSY